MIGKVLAIQVQGLEFGSLEVIFKKKKARCGYMYL